MSNSCNLSTHDKELSGENILNDVIEEDFPDRSDDVHRKSAPRISECRPALPRCARKTARV